MRTSASLLHFMMVTASIFVAACTHGSGGARHPAPTPLLVEPITAIRADGLQLQYQGATCTRFVVDSRSGLPGGRVIPCPGGLATSLDGRAVQLMAGSRSIASTTLREGRAILLLDWSSSLSEEKDLQLRDWSIHVDGMRPVRWRPTQEQIDSVTKQVQETRRSGSLHAELTVEGGFVINGLPSALTLTIENRNAVPALGVTAVWSAPAGDPFNERHGTKKLRSNHLYQLSTYLDHFVSDLPVSGLLLYAGPPMMPDQNYRIRGRDIHIRSLLLDQPWPQIHCDLIEIVVRLHRPQPQLVAQV